MKPIIIEPVIHRSQKRVKIVFEYDKKTIETIRKIPDCKWSATMGCWHVPNYESTYKQFSELGIICVEKSPTDKKLNKRITEDIEAFKRYIKWKRLSSSTIISYSEAIKKFFIYFSEKKSEVISNNDINDYMYKLVKDGLSSSMQNITISAIKLYYQKIENKKLEIEKIERPRKTRPLPKVIPKEDIERLISTTSNLKHKTILLIIYSLGLRRSELLKLKLRDIDSQRMVVNILNAKGQKDRVLPLSEKLLTRLKTYYKAYKPKNYLFESTKQGIPYSGTSLRELFKNNMERIKPGNRYTLHCLRHSFATHLLEQGVDIRYIQEFLGHKSSRTTEIYTHVSINSLRNIKNVIDDLDI